MVVQHWQQQKCRCRNIECFIRVLSTSRLLQFLCSSIILALLLFPFSVTANDEPLWKAPNEDNFILLEVRLGNTLISDLITAYQHDNGIVLPLGHLSEILDLAIEVQAEKGQAVGFVLDEERTFYLELGRKELELNQELVPFNSDLVLANYDDIYVESHLLSKWLPIDFNVNLFSSRVTVNPREPLPMQERAEREQRIKKARANMARERPQYPRQDLPYRLWDIPMLDQSLTLQARRNTNSSNEYDFNYNAYFTGDLLYMETSLFTEITRDEGFKEFRPSFSRKSDEADLLGPMELTEVNFGYITFPNIPIISAAPPTSQGVMISTYPLTRQSTYDTQTFQGDLPPGWEVELYHNNALIDYMKSDVNREYRFQNVQLLFGRNIFRLVFYGPQGQQREEEYVFEVGSQLTPPGKIYYRTAQRWDENGHSRTEAQVDIGLHKRASLSANYANLYFQQQRQQYIKFAANTLLGRYFFRAAQVVSDQESSASSLNLQTKFYSVNVNANIMRFNQFFSEEFRQEQDPLTWRYLLRFDSALPGMSFLPRIPFNFELEQDQKESGLIDRRLGNRAFIYIAGTSLANQINWTHKSTDVDLISGSFQASRRLGNHGIRINSGYEAHPEQRISSITGSFNFNFDHGQRLTLGSSYTVSNDITRYSLGYSKSRGKVSIGANAEYIQNNAANDSLSISLTFTSGLGRDPIRGHWFSEAGSMAKYGALAARVFLDENNNGEYDSGETLVPDAGISTNASQTKARSGKDGVVFVNGIIPHNPTSATLALETLEDPAWLPSFKGLEFIPRPGKILKIDIPIVESGEIDGTTYLIKNGKQITAGDVQLELVREDGKVVSQTKSAYDGFYILSNIPPGTYILRINRQQFERLNLTEPKVQIVTIDSENQFIYGLDLILKQ